MIMTTVSEYFDKKSNVFRGMKALNIGTKHDF